VANSSSTLTVLKLDSCTFLNGKLLKSVCRSAPNLVKLSLASCKNVNKYDEKEKDGFVEISSLKNLESLNLYRTLITQIELKHIIMSCSKLKHLNLGSCTEISNFDDVASWISLYIPHIESLDLWRALSLTNKGLEKIANSCVKLKELDIGWWFVFNIMIVRLLVC
jgi:hypothetical protein